MIRAERVKTYTKTLIVITQIALMKALTKPPTKQIVPANKHQQQQGHSIIVSYR